METVNKRILFSVKWITKKFKFAKFNTGTLLESQRKLNQKCQVLLNVYEIQFPGNSKQGDSILSKRLTVNFGPQVLDIISIFDADVVYISVVNLSAPLCKPSWLK